MSLGVHDRVELAANPFSSSRRLAIAEHLRIPCDDAGGPAGGRLGRLRTGAGAELLWPGAGDGDAPAVSARVPAAAGAQIPIFARLIDDRSAAELLAGSGGDWQRELSLTGEDDEHVASIWRARDGSVFLPFDPDEVCESYWSERYLEVAKNGASRRTVRGVVWTYYRVRGLLPRPAQIWLRRRYARVQARSQFPSWPAETALHDFFDLFTSILADVGGEPVPRIAAWPREHTWALVLTHDVESARGVAALEPILEIERALGLRSSWNFVPRRYHVSDERIRELTDEGFEVGVHGLYHDGRDLESLSRMRERLPGMREAAARWGAIGFRSPATQRQWELMPQLGFDYDCSYPDTDPFEPQAGGCCTWLPFFNREMVELPMTMPQDHTLFTILRHSDEAAWVQKAEFLRARGGMALIDTHPDYLTEERVRHAYARLLERYAGDESAWKALPREVSAWWRARARSRAQRAGTDWVVSGPAAAQARVELVEGAPWR